MSIVRPIDGNLRSYVEQVIADGIEDALIKQEKIVRNKFSQKGFVFDNDTEWHDFLKERVTCFITHDNVRHLIVDANTNNHIDICSYTDIERTPSIYNNGDMYTMGYEFKIT